MLGDYLLVECVFILFNNKNPELKCVVGRSNKYTLCGRGGCN